MEDLPFEIWQLIANYLPDEQVRQLCCVNRAFLNIALDLRYREAGLRVYPDRSVKMANQQMQLQDLLNSSTRPSCLRVFFHDRSPGPDAVPNAGLQMAGQPIKASSSRSFLKLILKSRSKASLGERKAKPRIPVQAKLTETAADVIPQLTRVAKVRLAYANEVSLAQHEDGASKIFSEILGFIGNRLQSLHIQSRFAAFLSNVRFESLSAFSVEALGWYHTTDVHDVMAMEVPSFLLAHEPTIRKVSFSVDDPTLQVSPILYCLQSLARLTDIDLILPYATTLAPFEGQEVLRDNQHNLKSLTLNILNIVDDSSDTSTFRFFFRGWWFPVNVPHLRELTIRIPRTFFSQEMNGYLQPFSFSLVSLTIALEPAAQYTDVTAVCNVITDLPVLQEFSLNVYQLSPTILSVFARTLPHLRYLHLDYSYVVHYRDPRKDLKNGKKLDDEMKPYTTEFSDWQLEELSYLSPNYPPNDWVDGIMAAFLPNALWICSQPRHLCHQTWLSHSDSLSAPAAELSC